jgi:prepilin signal peptidase PulO-like enzyme (type II secretory pathway)
MASESEALLCFMCSRIFFSFLRIFSLFTFEYFFFPDGLGQSHSSTDPYCSSICLPVTRVAFIRSRFTSLLVPSWSAVVLALAIILEGDAMKRLPLCSLDSFILVVLTSGQGILPDWHAVQITITNNTARILIQTRF